MTPRRAPALYLLLITASAGSAICGFAREAAIGALFGASRSADAYYAALAIPFATAYFLVGGALAPPLTAAVTTLLAQGDVAAARGLASRALQGLLLAGTIVAVLLALVREPLCRLLVPGFDAAARAGTARLLSLLTAYGVLTALALLGGALLTAAGAYRTPALAALFGNAVSVGVLLLARGRGIEAAAWAMDAGSAAFVLSLLPALFRTGFLSLRPAGAAPFPWREAGVLTVSLAAAGAVDLAERPFASTAGVGAIALLAFASKLIHLPMRLVAAPLASVVFPRFVRTRTSGQRGAETGLTTRLTVDLLLFSAAVAAGAAGPIVALTFGRGRFDASAVTALARTLRILSPAIVAIGFLEIAGKLLLAAGRASAVARGQLLGLAAYLSLAPFLVRFGVEGLALARDAAWCTAAATLAFALVRHERGLGLLDGASRSVAGTAAGLAAALLAAYFVPGGSLLRTSVAALAAGFLFFALVLRPYAREALA